MTAPNAPSIRVGLDNVYYALLQSDPTDGSLATYGTPVHIINAVSADVQPKSNMAVFYADDGAAETASAIGEITVDFEVNALPSSAVAALLGASVGTDGTVLQGSIDNAPYVALGFRAKKANNKYRYKWLYKGKFQWVQESYKTEAGSPEGQTEKISGTFIRRQCDNAMQIFGDEDDASFTRTDTWFDQVVVQNATSTALTVTATPANGASGVADNTTAAWAFSAAINPLDVTAANFFLLDASGNQIAGSLSLSADQKTVTFTPSASLAATTKYMAIATAAVRDIAGNTMAANSVTEFTTT